MEIAQRAANEWSSGGTYDMAALWIKGKPRDIGYNRLDSPAHLKSDIYPEMCGMHAELSLWNQNRDMSGGTVYVAGKLNSSSSRMTTTQPCIYCAALLETAGIRFVVYILNGIMVKSKPKHLLGD